MLLTRATRTFFFAQPELCKGARKQLFVDAAIHKILSAKIYLNLSRWHISRLEMSRSIILLSVRVLKSMFFVCFHLHTPSAEAPAEQSLPQLKHDGLEAICIMIRCSGLNPLPFFLRMFRSKLFYNEIQQYALDRNNQRNNNIFCEQRRR